MHIKALTAIPVIAVFAAGFLQPTHAKALSQTTTNNSNSGNANTVTVAPGDSLASIAQKKGTTYVRLFDANSEVQNPDLIYPGQVISIPSSDEQLPDRFGAVEAAAVTSETVSSPPAATQASYDQPVTPAAAPVAVTVSAPVGASVWTRLAQCESSGNWAANTGNGFYGGLQFTLSSWQSVGGTGLPSQASASEQIARAEMLQARQGWGAWPVCSVKVGL